jgi:hypothetical protein
MSSCGPSRRGGPPGGRVDLGLTLNPYNDTVKVDDYVMSRRKAINTNPNGTFPRRMVHAGNHLRLKIVLHLISTTGTRVPLLAGDVSVGRTDHFERDSPSHSR